MRSTRCNRKCGCYLEPASPLWSNISYLSVLQLMCGQKVYSSYFRGNIQELCSECPVECDSESFYLSSSTSVYPTPNRFTSLISKDVKPINMFKQNNYSNDVMYTEFRRSTIALNIFYDDLKYTEITEEIKTSLADLVSSLGGTLGLFLGMSFLSLVEFIEMFLEIIYVITVRGSRKKSNNLLTVKSKDHH